MTERIRGELGALTMARSRLLQLRESAHKLHDGVDHAIQANQPQDKDSKRDKTALLIPNATWSVLEHDAASAALQAQDAQTYIQEAISHYRNSNSFVAANVVTGTQSQGGTKQLGTDDDYIQQQRDALEQIGTITSGLVTATNALTPTLMKLRSVTATQDITQAAKLQGLLLQAEDVFTRADVAAASMIGIDFDGLPIFLWNGVLYAVLVLFPWLLLLLFLYRKRVNLAAQIYDDLRRLDPNEGLLRRVLQGNSGRRERQHVERLLRTQNQPNARTAQQDAGPYQSPAHVQPAGAVPSALSQQPIVGNDTGASPATGGDTPSDMSLPEQRGQDIVDALAKRTFGEFEYLISLVFLTLLLAAGWYYLFYPQTSIGLTFLIERGAGVRQLLSFMTANLTPLTMAFAGAYFFLMQMLVRRYLSNDLYPTAFLQAALRLLVVFLLSLALTVLPAIGVDPEKYVFTKDLATAGALALLVAFLVGIYPTSGFKLIVTTVNRLLGRSIFPSTLVPEPLTKLTGVTIWVEARLFEENIESIEAMATAPIEQLIVNTHFPTAQIVDWIDQAILYLHCGHDGEWFPQLRAVGIRGASDLLDAVGFNLLAPYESLEQGG